MDAILEFRVHAIIKGVDLKPSEHDVENAINEILCEGLGTEMFEISELSVGYEIQTPCAVEGEEDGRSDK